MLFLDPPATASCANVLHRCLKRPPSIAGSPHCSRARERAGNRKAPRRDRRDTRPGALPLGVISAAPEFAARAPARLRLQVRPIFKGNKSRTEREKSIAPRNISLICMNMWEKGAGAAPGHSWSADIGTTAPSPQRTGGQLHPAVCARLRNTTSVIGNSVLALLRNPTSWPAAPAPRLSQCSG